MTLLIHAVGDLVLERPDASALLDAAAPVLATADLVVGQLEIPHLDGGQVHSTDVPAIPGPPSALDAVASAGFDVLTLAGNHIYDWGPDGVEQTRENCRARGILTCGAGTDLDEAYAPAIVQLEGRRVGIVSVNCVGPRESWASSVKAGAAYVDVVTHYATQGANPGGPPRIHTFADPASLQDFTRRIALAAAEVDLLVVALHKGLVHVPAEIAEYEFEIAHAAIDVGAAAVVGHHAHIMKGVELYRERPIFHGLGNFATVTQALSARPGGAAERQDWARRRQTLFGFVPDASMPDYPFHPESRHTMIATLELHDDRLVAGVVPCWIDDDAVPTPTGQGARGEQVAEYLRGITRRAGLATEYHWNGDQLTVQPTNDRETS